MPNRMTSARVISRGGLDTNENYLHLSANNPGAATRLVNYETAQKGGYRRINGYTELDSTAGAVGGVSGTGRILGVWGFRNTTTGNDEILTARKDASGNTYSIYKLQVGVSWDAQVLGVVQSTLDGTSGTIVTKVRAEAFNFGTVNMICFVDGVNPALVYDGTAWYRLLSSNAGTSVSPGGNQLLDQPSIVTSYRGHLFLSGDENTPGIVCHSAPNDPFDFTAAGGGGQIIYGYEVNALKPFRNELYAFGKSTIKKIEPNSDLSGFTINDVATNVGCIARDSVIEMAGNLLFMSADGIRPIAGTDRVNDIELSLLSQQIQSVVDNFIDTYDIEELNAIVIREKQQFRYFISSSAIDATDAEGIIGALRIDNQEGQLWEFGTLLGIRTSCSWSGILESSVEWVLHGDHDGKVYRQERGNDFNGTDVLAIYNTPYLDFGDTETRKLLRKINTFIEAEGDVSFDIGLRFDWGSDDVLNPSNYTGQSTGASAFYGTGIYDTSIYGGASREVLTTNIQGSCFSVRFSYVTQGDYAPYTIFGFVTEFSTKGKE